MYTCEVLITLQLFIYYITNLIILHKVCLKYAFVSTLSLIFNNLELTNRSKEHLNYINLYPNTTLSAEYDITEQIYLTNKTYEIKASFRHVYGRQNTKSRGEMLIEATLNVIADKLSGDYQDQLGAYSPITHMYPSSLTVLEINGMTITSSIQYHLIKAYAEPKYMEYLQWKNKWNRKTV